MCVSFFHPSACFQVLLEALAGYATSKAMVRLFNPQELVMFISAFAHLNLHNEGVMRAVAAHLLQTNQFLTAFKPRELVHTLWAFARLRVRHEVLRVLRRWGLSGIWLYTCALVAPQHSPTIHC